MTDLLISWGDHCTVEDDEDGRLSVKIQNQVFYEEPRWLTVEVTGGDRDRYINELIEALEGLRERTGR